MSADSNYVYDMVDVENFEMSQRIRELEAQRDKLVALLVQAEDALSEYGFAREGPEKRDMMDEIKAAIARRQDTTREAGR